MIINGVQIDETFAEAFPMKATRLIITADSKRWAFTAANSMIGFSTSVIACGVETGIERELRTYETLDKRPGISVLLFAMSGKQLIKHVITRTGQCVMTTPTTACFSGIEEGAKIKLGAAIRYFGDGFQISKLLGGKRYWRIPIMDGEFLCEDYTYQVPAVGGGNFLICAKSRRQALRAAERAIKAMSRLPNVIMPFPGGVVGSGSKVGSKYKALIASTNEAFCPTLKGVTKTELSPDTESVMEIVINGLSEDDVARAMRVGVRAVCELGKKGGITRITAGNYGGKLGPYHFHLHKILKAGKKRAKKGAKK